MGVIKIGKGGDCPSLPLQTSGNRCTPFFLFSVKTTGCVALRESERERGKEEEEEEEGLRGRVLFSTTRKKVMK